MSWTVIKLCLDVHLQLIGFFKLITFNMAAPQATLANRIIFIPYNTAQMSPSASTECAVQTARLMPCAVSTRRRDVNYWWGFGRRWSCRAVTVCSLVALSPRSPSGASLTFSFCRCCRRSVCIFSLRSASFSSSSTLFSVRATCLARRAHSNRCCLLSMDQN